MFTDAPLSAAAAASNETFPEEGVAGGTIATTGVVEAATGGNTGCAAFCVGATAFGDTTLLSLGEVVAIASFFVLRFPKVMSGSSIGKISLGTTESVEDAAVGTSATLGGVAALPKSAIKAPTRSAKMIPL